MGSWEQRMFERALEGLALLTQQVSRLAFAVEAQANMRLSDMATCPACRSMIQAKGRDKCFACGEDMKHG